MWEYWCKSIGVKAYEDNNKADRVAIIRTGWVVLHILTCLAIILNAIANHGWGLIGWKEEKEFTHQKQLERSEDLLKKLEMK
jgi:hypothetical protein